MYDSLDLSVSKAREIVVSLSRRMGWVEDEARAGADPRFVESYDEMRREFGDTLGIITTDIYSRKSRFILELIQNVEDCRFDRTDRVPSISFDVHPDKIVIESNEDGFTENDVRQICRTGRSWKRQQRGYVGDKGIGFKSVFQVASRVHIQSNSFSFSFEYNGGDTSEEKLGIITPIPEDDPIPLNERPLTRMTLTPNKTPYEEMFTYFENIHISLLLFLAKIQEIAISIHRPCQATTKTIFRKSKDTESNLTNLTTIVVEGEVEPRERVTDTSRYRIFSDVVSDLPPNEARPNINTCDLVLAFPVDELDHPVRPNGHDIFAYLPVSTVGLNFLIQADFILRASREEVMFDSTWNSKILRHISTAFCTAVSDFCGRESPLRYQWVKYLPDGRALEMSPFWKEFSSDLMELLKRKVFFDYMQQLLLQNLAMRLERDHLGAPKYLSLRYDPEDIETLKRIFKLQDIGNLEMCTRIGRDLEGPRSVMKSEGTDDDWHSRAARLISSILTRCRGTRAEIEIREKLPLVPLIDGRWVCASEGHLYFPSETGPAIPRDLFITIRPQAVANDSRRLMFKDLGATYCPPQTVVDKLWLTNSMNDGPLDLASSKAHLSYLYWNHEDTFDPRFLNLSVYDTRGNKVASLRKVIYLLSKDEYGPQQLFKSVRYVKRIVPECEVSFLNAEYMEIFSPSTRRHDWSWLNWLKTVVGVRDVPRLKFEAGSLSTEFRYILLNKPKKIIGTLKTHWDTYRPQISSAIEEEISTANVACSGVPPRALNTTYFPTVQLKEEAQSLGIGICFPFLRLTSSQESDPLEDWRFLERFQVRFEASIAFYLEVLIQHQNETQKVWNDKARADILRTYALIADHYSESNKAILVGRFYIGDLILDPCSFESDSTHPSWIGIDSCRWKGPENLLFKSPLASVSQYRNDRKLTRLFHDILDIKDVSWKDYEETLMELKTGKDLPIDITDRVPRLYKLFSETNINDRDWNTIRKNFESKRLIYVPSSSDWFPPSKCLWSSPVSIEDKAVIGNDYPPELRGFFLTRLQISPASLATIVEGLRSLSEGTPSVADVKQMIRAINAMNPKVADLDSLRTCNILPMGEPGSDDNLRLKSVQDNFAVIDRAKLVHIFKGHVELLAFSLEEVRQLDPFLQALGLHRKFLSQLCVEETASGEDSGVDERLTREFKDRAYDLLRCAVSYRSPLSPQRLYDGLLASSVLKSDTISTQYTIHYTNGEMIGPISRSTGYVHIEDQEVGWRIFVPRDRRNREVSYKRNLPEALTKLFEISTSVREVIANVLTSSSFVIDDLLEAAGIGKVSEIEPPARFMAGEPDEQEEVIAEQVAASERATQTHSAPLLGAERSLSQAGPSDALGQKGTQPASSVIGEDFRRVSRLSLAFQDNRANTVIFNADYASVETVPASQASPEPRMPPQGPILGDILRENIHGNLDAYRELLDHVIRIASQTNFPNSNLLAGPINGQVLQGFDHEAAFGVRSQNQMRHDSKIGAAGELFAFETLQTVLQSFGIDNWRSKIRSEVTVHPTYRDMEHWKLRETADIVYKDINSQLTTMLIQRGYLENVWSGANPNYLIEVKTTTGDCGDRFFMSRNQYHMMQEMALRPGEISEEIYIIFRVFNLGKESMSMKLYTDPEAYRQRNALIFETQTWTVTPGP